MPWGCGFFFVFFKKKCRLGTSHWVRTCVAYQPVIRWLLKNTTKFSFQMNPVALDWTTHQLGLRIPSMLCFRECRRVNRSCPLVWEQLTVALRRLCFFCLAAKWTDPGGASSSVVVSHSWSFAASPGNCAFTSNLCVTPLNPPPIQGSARPQPWLIVCEEACGKCRNEPCSSISRTLE